MHKERINYDKVADCTLKHPKIRKFLLWSVWNNV